MSPKPRQYHATTRFTGGKYPDSIEQIVIGPNEYQRTPGDATWVHLDLSRIKVTSLEYIDMTDPTGLARWTASILDVQRTGPQSFTGTFAPDSATGNTLPLGTPTLTVFFFGTPPTFVATTDDAGRITSVTIKMKVSDDKKPINVTTKLSGYGANAGIKAPAKSHVSEAADFYYDS